jgi:hypothetical protein
VYHYTYWHSGIFCIFGSQNFSTTKYVNSFWFITPPVGNYDFFQHTITLHVMVNSHFYKIRKFIMKMHQNLIKNLSENSSYPLKFLERTCDACISHLWHWKFTHSICSLRFLYHLSPENALPNFALNHVGTPGNFSFEWFVSCDFSTPDLRGMTWG